MNRNDLKSLMLILLPFFITAQQDPQYTQYMYNMNVINPAYAGNSEGFVFGLLYRSQWAGLDGGPRTFTFSGHASINEQIGLGLSLIADQIGPVKETNTFIDFSYTVKTGEKSFLAFGLKGGFTFHDIGISSDQILIIDPGDPFFSNNINEVTPNIGAGLYYFQPNLYYVSFSIPNMIKGVHLDLNDTKIGSETQHVFVASGYVFSLSEELKLKPHVLLKYAYKSPFSFDINANLFMYDIVEIGLGYRLDDSFSGMINFQVLKDLKIGYAYDNIRSNLNIATNASHEIFLNFEILTKQKAIRSPRYF